MNSEKEAKIINKKNNVTDNSFFFIKPPLYSIMLKNKIKIYIKLNFIVYISKLFQFYIILLYFI